MEEKTENETEALQLSECFCLNDLVTYGVSFWIEREGYTDLIHDNEQIYYCRYSYFDEVFEAICRYFDAGVRNGGECFVHIAEESREIGNVLVFGISAESKAAPQVTFAPNDYMPFFGVSDVAAGMLLYEQIDEAYHAWRKRTKGEKA